MLNVLFLFSLQVGILQLQNILIKGSNVEGNFWKSLQKEVSTAMPYLVIYNLLINVFGHFDKVLQHLSRNVAVCINITYLV